MRCFCICAPGSDSSTHRAANIFHRSWRQRCACIRLRLRMSWRTASILWH